MPEPRQLAEQWGIALLTAGLAILAIAVMSNQRDLPSLCRRVFVGLFVGAVTNLGFAGTTWLFDNQRGAVAGVAVVVSEDVVAALIRLVRELRENSLGFVNWFLVSFTILTPMPTSRNDDRKQD